MIKFPRPNLIWLGIAMAVLYWVVESEIHTYIFNLGPLATTLLSERDPNEVQMRLVAVGLLAVLGGVAEAYVRIERRMKEDARRISSLLHVVERVQHSVAKDTAGSLSASQSELGLPPPAARAVSLMIEPVSSSDDIQRAIRGSNIGEDIIERLGLMLRELSLSLEARFKELYTVMELTSEISSGVLLDEVMEKAYLSLRSVIPYNRLGLALMSDDGSEARAQWAKSDSPQILLGAGYRAPLHGSSLVGIIASGEPRIINDLVVYLGTHPDSESTRLMVGEGIRSSLTCPLISMGKPIGFLFFSSRQVDVYKNVHIDVFRLIATHLSIVVEKSNLYQQVLQEKEKSETLLLNVMPDRIATRLKAGEANIAENLMNTGVLFADIVSFTDFSSRYTPDLVVRLLQDLFAQFDHLCDAHGVEKIKTIGDCYMAICSPRDALPNEHVRQLAAFALAMLRAAKQIRYPDGQQLNLRIGMQIGSVVAGVIGQKKFAYDIWGDAVNVASRMQSTGEPGCIHVSEDFRGLLGDEFVFERRGEINVKGKGPMMTYYLVGRKDAAPPTPILVNKLGVVP